MAQPPAPASATMVWVDAGGARVQQPTSALRSAGSVGAGVWHARGRVALAAEGSLTLGGQYVVRGTVRPWAFLRTDVDLSATSNGGVAPGRDGNRAIAVSPQVSLGPLELRLLAGLGRTMRVGTPSEGRRVGAMLAWQRRSPIGTLRVGGQYVRGWTDDYRLMEASGIVLRRLAAAYALADGQFDAAWQRGALGVQVSRAWRAGLGATRGTASAFHLAAAWNRTPSTALIAQVGEQLADVVRGVPQARYTGLGVRWNPVRPRLPGDARRGARGRPTIPDLRGDEVLVERTAGHGEVTIRIRAPMEADVEVATSATEWTPTRAIRDGDRFVHRFTLPSGTHRVAVRVNGGDWRAPRGLAVVDDGFGGKAGLVVIP